MIPKWPEGPWEGAAHLECGHMRPLVMLMGVPGSDPQPPTLYCSQCKVVEKVGRFLKPMKTTPGLSDTRHCAICQVRVIGWIYGSCGEDNETVEEFRSLLRAWHEAGHPCQGSAA